MGGNSDFGNSGEYCCDNDLLSDFSKSGYSVEFCDLGESGGFGKSDTFDKSEVIFRN